MSVKQAAFPVLLVLTTVMLHCGSTQIVGTAESCEAQVENQSWNRMEVLPGTGWDNLRNMDMGLVFEYSYTQCQLTNDRKFLLPDGYFAIPLQKSDVETFSELIDHWESHTSLTSYSINAEAKGHYGGLVEGKFSSEYTKAKTNMYNGNHMSSISRIQTRHKLYSVHLQFGTKLNPTFKGRLLDIASYIITNNSDVAHYLSEILIRDYGTHFTTVAHAGAILVMEDYIQSDFAISSEETRQKIKASTSISFFGKIGGSASIGFDHNTDETFTNSYLSKRTYSHIRTFGGPPYRINFTIDDWEDGIPNALVAIDREGMPLHLAIIPEFLTELPPTQTLQLAEYIEKAINSYYKHNTHHGCTNPNAENFYFGANADDGTCEPSPLTYFRFGGVFQTCSHIPTDKTDVVCPGLLQKNPLTGGYSCPLGYEAVLLYGGSKSGSYSTKTCKKEFIFHKCHHVNNPVTGYYQTYWCVHMGMNDSVNSGYLFGGIYSSNTANPQTRAKSCPNYFYSLKFVGEDTHICVSPNFDLASSIPAFGGFKSCIAGNPLTTVFLNSSRSEPNQALWPHRCPPGYSQRVATIVQSCEINYCVKSGTFKFSEKDLPPIKLPPYQKYPNLNPNTSDVISILSSIGVLWEKNDETGEWQTITQLTDIEKIENFEDLDNATNVTNETSNETYNSYHTESNSVSTAAVIISTTALLGLLIAGSVYIAYKYKGRKTRRHGNYENIEKTDATNSNQQEPPADV